MTSSISPESQENFKNRMVNTVEQGFLAISLHIGHKLGLFDTIHQIASQESPKTSQEIAAAAHCKERYVLEWLRGMVAGNVVECNSDATKFWLPKHRLPSLTNEGPTPCDLLHHFAGMSHEMDSVLDCFKPDGPQGLPYSRYANFYASMADFSRSNYEHNLIPKFVPSVPGLEAELESGIHVLDLGCGAGVAMKVLAERFPKSQFCGIDIDQDAVAMGNSAVEKMENVQFEVMDACHLKEEWANSFHFVTTFDSVHDQGSILQNVKFHFALGLHTRARNHMHLIVQHSDSTPSKTRKLDVSQTAHLICV